MTSERRRLERLEKSVEKLRIGIQKLLEQSQGRCQRQHKSRKDRRPSPPLPQPPSPLPSLSPEEEEEDDDDFFEEPPPPPPSPPPPLPLPNLPLEGDEDDDDQIFVSVAKEELSDSLVVIWDECEELTKEENEELQWILEESHDIQKKGDEQDLVTVNEPGSVKTTEKNKSMILIVKEMKFEKAIEKIDLSGERLRRLRFFAKVAFGISLDQHEQCVNKLGRSSCFSESELIGKQVDEIKHRWKRKGEGPN